ncbi:MAG: glycoside hydrolase [Ruminococcus bicirculans]|uniref:glycosyl hydrolase n=1 Tax=Ruminococcus bicirculans (ex Wegman et al. 2014) TaxID=1160721 RepID=UPI00242A91E6|nr:glycosyl hydrolase [Ruminococcus bicirculans (ex Wegman et al. 2014)]MBS6817721.1 glycoside hydrolase [Ruminococcus bicirculans (ex Wegman et al. 2014)]
MRHYRIMAAAVAAICTLSGCGVQIGRNESMTAPEKTSVVTTTKKQTNDDSKADEQALKSYEETKIVANAIPYVKFSKSVEAEKGAVSGKAKVKSDRKGYKGKGYVTNISTEEDWSREIELTDSQYYDLTITVASDVPCVNGIAVNGKKLQDFSASGSGKFEKVTFKNIYIEKGKTAISVIPVDGGLDVDSLTLTASEDISKLDLTISKPALSNKDSDYNAKALYQYLCESYGKQVLLGQHDTIGTSAETDMIYKTTGKYPTIRFGDLMLATENDSITTDTEMNIAMDWASKDGIVGYMWHWAAPDDKREYYADQTDFDIKKAVTKENIAELSLEDIKKLQKDGKVSKECVAVVEDIDTVSEKLSTLRDEGIAVLWRPLHEASNGDFWWGNDKEAYKWLWKLMYERQTKYHKLNNLIWVWSAQNADWYVGDEYCDVLSCDVYDDGNKDAQVNIMLFLQSISKNKPIAMGECGSFPDIQSIADEKAMWAFIGQWGGNYLMTDDGKLAEENNTAAELIKMYNNNLTLTRDKLPDFTHLASSIKDTEEKSAESKKNDSSKADSKTKKENTSKAE